VGTLRSVAFITATTRRAPSASAQGWLKLFVDPKTPSEKDYALLIDNNFHNFSIGADTRGKWLTSDAAI
jgi:hypothetical protein